MAAASGGPGSAATGTGAALALNASEPVVLAPMPPTWLVPSTSARARTAASAPGKRPSASWAVMRANQASKAGGSVTPLRRARAVAGSRGPAITAPAKTKTLAASAASWAQYELPTSRVKAIIPRA